MLNSYYRLTRNGVHG